jgi:hypothetical protein
MLGMSLAGGAVFDFSGRVDSPEKQISMSLDHAFDAIDFNNVGADTHNLHTTPHDS